MEAEALDVVVVDADVPLVPLPVLGGSIKNFMLGNPASKLAFEKPKGFIDEAEEKLTPEADDPPRL